MRQEGEPKFKPNQEVSFRNSNGSIITTSIRYSAWRIDDNNKESVRYLLMGFAQEFDENELEANFSRLRDKILKEKRGE